MDNRFRITYLLKKWANDTISEAEKVELFTYLNKEKSNNKFFRAFDEIWKDIPAKQTDNGQHQKVLYQKILLDPRYREVSLKNLKKERNSKLLIKILAASVFIIISFTIYFYFENKEFSHSRSSELTYIDIPPGKDEAVLELADGTIISLNEVRKGESLDQSGISVSKTEDGQIIYKISDLNETSDSLLFNKVSTPRGGRYHVILADGTKVWLNAASSLKYPAKFHSNERNVELSGEAYFEVAKGKIPFNVVTKNQKVEVLGTHFNINSYEDEATTKTTLLEGSVRIKNHLLKPGEQAILKENVFNIIKADIETAIDWKNNDFVFKEESINNIMNEISRWYDIEVEYIGENDKLRFGGFVSRKKNISTILEVLESTGLVKFKVEGRRVIVMI